ncbi:MAG TPA: NAD(P)-dependent oxidoreductase [Stellaceae bacterium]|nr:NAD(P)-dependent oxidoreductase [Stellaceae bacterium]
MTRATLAVTFALEPRQRALVEEAAGAEAQIVWLAGLDPAARAAALRSAGAVLARHTNELTADEKPLIAGARLLQMMTAGIDYIPLAGLPPGLTIASNRGGFSEPMAEHAVALALAAAKRLLVEHRNLERGEFNQFTRNRMLAGGVCGIYGYGGIGAATARRMRGLGMRIHALNRSGRTGDDVDWIGAPGRLHELLRASDVLVIATPLTRTTHLSIAASELALMKEDAILVNLARGEIVDEDALYRHLCVHPRFSACLDAWWVEPMRHGAFRLDHPFLDLPNVIGSPHNSAMVPELYDGVLRYAVANCLRAIRGEAPERLVADDERMG